MPQSDVLGWIEHVRLLIEAVSSGRVEARTVKDMTDEQLEEYVAKLRDELADEVEKGKKLHE